MQVYRDLRIITARPTPAEEARVPHRLYGHVDAAENHSVGRWLRDVEAALVDVAASGRLPILVGGTGLYFKALTEGLAAVPPISADIRAAIRGRLASEGVAALHAELAACDPEAAGRLMPNDRARIARALEVVTATGRSLSAWHGEGLPPILAKHDTVRVFLTPERAALYQRIETRFDAMMAEGALDEVSALAARGLDPALPAMKAHGVPWLMRYRAGDITREEALEGSKRDTRRYTKRQVTWFRHQLSDWTWLAPEAAANEIARAVAAWS